MLTAQITGPTGATKLGIASILTRLRIGLVPPSMEGRVYLVAD